MRPPPRGRGALTVAPQTPDKGNRDALSSAERRGLRRLGTILELADVMAVLMVVATVFTGIATWRTASIAEALYLTSERPYLGTGKVWLEKTPQGDPRVFVEYENFGAVAAEDTVVRERLLVDGKPLAGRGSTLAAGIISPRVPHRTRAHLDRAHYADVVAGRSQLVVEVAMRYHGPRNRPLCYLERFVYVHETDDFEVHGGSPRCADQSG
jgi:hypothetical protein